MQQLGSPADKAAALVCLMALVSQSGETADSADNIHWSVGQTSQVPQQLKPSQLVQQSINPHHGQLDTNVLQAAAAAHAAARVV